VLNFNGDFSRHQFFIEQNKFEIGDKPSFKSRCFPLQDLKFSETYSQLLTLKSETLKDLTKPQLENVKKYVVSVESKVDQNLGSYKGIKWVIEKVFNAVRKFFGFEAIKTYDYQKGAFSRLKSQIDQLNSPSASKSQPDQVSMSSRPSPKVSFKDLKLGENAFKLKEMTSSPSFTITDEEIQKITNEKAFQVKYKHGVKDFTLAQLMILTTSNGFPCIKDQSEKIASKNKLRYIFFCLSAKSSLKKEEKEGLKSRLIEGFSHCQGDQVKTVTELYDELLGSRQCT
jgi:hypothetical protein